MAVAFDPTARLASILPSIWTVKTLIFVIADKLTSRRGERTNPAFEV
jgi:hypothetical protein